MGYSSSTITAASQIAALLATFAAGLGFTVDNTTPAAPIITLPGDEDDSNSTDITVKWGISNTTVSSVSLQNFFLQFPAGATNQAFCRGPCIDGVALAPTRVEFIGLLTPIPYIAIVISFGTNLHRHLYLGRLEKKGRYGGGEVISAQKGIESTLNGNFEYGSVKYLFGGGAQSQTPYTAGSNGFLRVKHADAPAEYNEFLCASETVTSTSNAGAIIGGFMDSINDGPLARSRMAYAGRTALVPCNLYQYRNISGSMHLVPVGRPTGYRMVNLNDVITPTTIVIGSDTWHVYPAMARNSSNTMPNNLVNFWRTFESSKYVGFAYKE